MALILGIESSCDETAAAVVEDGHAVRASFVASQDALHEEYGGVVPEIASRAHLERIVPVIDAALQEASCTLEDLDAIAVGNRPGLIGSLLVGIAAAKTLAWACERPLLAVDHVLAHLVTPALDGSPLAYPALALAVSGGHTALLHLDSPLHARVLARTIDDAAGEAFDKAAAMLDLGWPGGPLIEAAAKGGTPRHALPRPRAGSDFSFSGLKTALLYGIRGTPRRDGDRIVFERTAVDLSKQDRADWAASFQEAIVDTIGARVEEALEQESSTCLIAGGGVVANEALRARLSEIADRAGITLRLSPPQWCMDNAAMIAALGWHHLQESDAAGLDVTAATRGAA